MSEEVEARAALRLVLVQLEEAKSTITKALLWTCPHNDGFGVITTHDACPACGRLKPSLAS